MLSIVWEIAASQAAASNYIVQHPTRHLMIVHHWDAVEQCTTSLFAITLNTTSSFTTTVKCLLIVPLRRCHVGFIQRPLLSASPYIDVRDAVRSAASHPLPLFTAEACLAAVATRPVKRWCNPFQSFARTAAGEARLPYMTMYGEHVDVWQTVLRTSGSEAEKCMELRTQCTEPKRGTISRHFTDV